MLPGKTTFCNFGKTLWRCSLCVLDCIVDIFFCSSPWKRAVLSVAVLKHFCPPPPRSQNPIYHPQPSMFRGPVNEACLQIFDWYKLVWSKRYLKTPNQPTVVPKCHRKLQWKVEWWSDRKIWWRFVFPFWPFFFFFFLQNITFTHEWVLTPSVTHVVCCQHQTVESLNQLVDSLPCSLEPFAIGPALSL